MPAHTPPPRPSKPTPFITKRVHCEWVLPAYVQSGNTLTTTPATVWSQYRGVRRGRDQHRTRGVVNAVSHLCVPHHNQSVFSQQPYILMTAPLVDRANLEINFLSSSEWGGG